MSDEQTTQPSFSLSPDFGNFEQSNENKKLNDEDYQATLFGSEFWVHPNKSAKVKRTRNWFVAPNGQKFGREGYIGNPQNMIPKEVNNKTVGYRKAENMMDNLIAFGEIHYGAKFNPETNKFVKDKNIQRHSNLADFNRAINSYPKGTKKDVNPTISKEKYSKWKNIIEAFDAIETKSADPSFATRGAKGTGTETTRGERKRMAEKDDFYKVQDGVIQNHFNYLIGQTKKSAKTVASSIDYLYSFLAVNGYSGNPLYLTTDLRADYQDSTALMMDRMIQMLAVFEHFSTTYNTPSDWWSKGWTASDTYKDAQGQNLKFEGMPIDYAQAKHTLGSIATAKKVSKSEWDKRQAQWKDAGMSSVLTAKLGVALFLKDPVVPDHWDIPPQQKGQAWFRGVTRLSGGKTKAGDLGFGVAKNPDQIAIGLKFLETGIIHEFKTIGHHKIQVMNEATGLKEEVDRPIRKLVPAINKITGKLDVMENHYNDSLFIYKQWGLPFGRLAPANMMMRLALSGTGWRKSEGLTAQTKSVIDDKSAELSGIFKDVEGNLNIKFMTRKGFKWGNITHSSVLPSVSSEMFDSRHTCELVLEKSNFGKFKSNDPNSDDYLEIETALTKEEKEKNAPALEVKNVTVIGGKAKFGSQIYYKQEAGIAPITLIGYPNQFFPVDRIENIGNTEQSEMENDDGEMVADPNTGGLNFKSQREIAYLLNPLREMFTVMKDTKMTIKTPAEIKLTIDEARKTHNSKVDLTKSKAQQQKHKDKFQEFPINAMGFADDGDTSKHQSAKLKQDKHRYDSVQHYWRVKPLHSIRHLFAQVWLKQSGWNFGLVADFGHWAILDTLKVNYGDAPDTVMANNMANLWAKTESIAETQKNLLLLKKKIKAEQAVNFKKKVEETPDAVANAIKTEEAGEGDADSDTEQEPEVAEEPTETDLMDAFESVQTTETEMHDTGEPDE